MGKSQPRRCKNWLDTFLESTLELSEAPESFLLWTGLFCISAVAKRKIQFSQKLLKRYRIFPTTYMMFVAPPGVATKSTIAGGALSIINEMNDELGVVTSPAYINVGSTSGSPVKMLKDMSETLDGSMMLIAGEFGVLVSTMPEEMYEFLQKMYDSDATADKVSHTTIARGTEVVLNPSLNLLGCTTPEWMQENSGYMSGAGFAARTVFLFENTKRQRQLFYAGIGPDLAELKQLNTDLAKDLGRIGLLKGYMEPESKALADKMEAWYQKVENFQGEQGTETFQTRKHVHVLRTSMLLSLCERDDLVITEKHFDRALELIADVEKKLGVGLSGMGKNPYSASLYTVLDYIKAKQPVSRGQLTARFYPDFIDVEKELGLILNVLGVTGEIQKVTTGINEMYRTKKGGKE